MLPVSLANDSNDEIISEIGTFSLSDLSELRLKVRNEKQKHKYYILIYLPVGRFMGLDFHPWAMLGL